jgi:nitroimidazol reductase NimA-like FMN-containing flavoprotein (pyridoxamine 5'-phosphate oxidase superfamily)
MKHTERSQLRRLPKRGSHEDTAIYAVLDAGFLAHVGFQTNGQPFVIPTLYGRDEDKLYLHGSAASRMLRELETGVPVCVTVTLVDGLVLARSAFHHSMNYRSVVAFGVARAIGDPAEKIRALRVISEHLMPGRWNDVRGPSEKELKATAVLEFAIEEASSKVREGPPLDDEEDYNLPFWAGILPLSVEAHVPVPDPRLAEGIEIPEYIVRATKVKNYHGGTETRRLHGENLIGEKQKQQQRQKPRS